MEERNCNTCIEWDSNFCGVDQKTQGLCERTGFFSLYNQSCKRYKSKVSFRFRRIINKLKLFLYIMKKNF